MAAPKVQKNIAFAKQQLSAVLGNSSVVVKFVCVAVSLFYFVSFSGTAVQYLTVTPGYVTPPNFWFWTYLTHCLVEVHIWCVIVDICIVVLYGKLLEPLWGALEMLIFFVVVNTGVAFFSTMVYLCIYFVSRNEEYLFDIHIHGLAGYVAGFSVAVKQVMPDHVLINSPFGKLRNKHIPTLMLYLAIIMRIIGGVDGPYPIMFCNGLLVSWVYLRFYQKHSNGNRGDMADSFTFASFFPDSIQPFLTILSNAVFGFLVKLRICRKPERRYDVSAPTTITVSLPGTDPQDAERRRTLALKALNERMSKVDSQVSWPSMDEADSGNQADTESSGTDTPLLEVKTHKDVGEKGAGPKLAVPDFKENVKTLQTGDESS